MSKICRPPSAAGKFFTWGASSLGTFAIFKLSAPILEGGGTHFTLGSVHFSPFLLRELQGRVKKFSAALPRRHPREAAPPYFFTSGVDQKNFFTQGCTPPLPPLCKNKPWTAPGTSPVTGNGCGVNGGNQYGCGLGLFTFQNASFSSNDKDY